MSAPQRLDTPALDALRRRSARGEPERFDALWRAGNWEMAALVVVAEWPGCLTAPEPRGPYRMAHSGIPWPLAPGHEVVAYRARPRVQECMDRAEEIIDSDAIAAIEVTACPPARPRQSAWLQHMAASAAEYAHRR